MDQAGRVVNDLHELWTKDAGPTKFPHYEHVGLTANGATGLAVELARRLLEPGEDADAVVRALLARAPSQPEGSKDDRVAQLTFADQLEFLGGPPHSTGPPRDRERRPARQVAQARGHARGQAHARGGGHRAL